jgi:D-amino-acid dehydrogenase
MSNGANGAAGGRGHVTVIGAGIVGACTALYLQREGFQVTLIDRGPPGEGSSLGNAGSFGRASIPPTSLPGLIRKLPRMLTNPLEPLAVRKGYFLFALPWFIRFLGNTRPEPLERIANARAALLENLFDAYEPLLKETGAHDMVKHDGKMHVYESPDGPARSKFALDMRRKRGIRVDVLTGDQAREMEPALGPNIKSAVFFPEVRNVSNPLRLVQRFVDQAVKNGAKLLREKVTGFEMGAGGPSAVITEHGRDPIDKLVIACGAWSDGLTRKLGDRYPIESERGYHAMITDPGVPIRSGFSSAERYIVLSQMEHGLRISGVSQFAGLETPPDYSLIDRILINAKAVVPGLRTETASKWSGPRPSLPDSVPVIGRAPSHANTWYAFGHDHFGIATGAITGRLISELMSGKPTTVRDMSPYSPSRFK